MATVLLYYIIHTVYIYIYIIIHTALIKAHVKYKAYGWQI